MTNAEKSQGQIPGLVRIATRAREHKAEVFNNLMHPLTPQLLEACILKIPKKTSPGVDSLSRDDVLVNLDWIGRKVLEDVHKGRYKPQPVKRVMIPKADGGQRPLGVPTVIDRGLQLAAATILESVYEQDFLEVSFGFRPNRSCHHALATLTHGLYQERFKYALEVDIRDFFGSLDHEWLRRFLRHRISDPRMLTLIDGWLKAGVMVNGEWEETTTGTIQGGSISPLLANVYLHYVLDLWFEKVMKRRLTGRSRLVRYADDFVILFEHEADRNGFLPVLKERFCQFNLEIAEEKTHQTDVDLASKDRKNKRRGIKFLGFVIHRAKTLSGKGTKLVFRTEGKRLGKAKANLKAMLKRVRHFPIPDQVRMLNWMLRGHYNYFGLPGNYKKLEELWHFAFQIWRRTLSTRSQNGKKSWEEILLLAKTHKVIAPSLKITYPDLSKYVLL